MSDATDYEKILAELTEERANIDRMIVWLQSKLGRAETEPAVPVPVVIPGNGSLPRPAEIMRFPRLREDTFFKMTVQEAIRAFLNIAKRPQSVRTITDALQQGGLTHKAKDLYQTVFPTLLRMKEKGEVEKLGNGDWGLSEWYGSARKTSPPNATENGE